MLDRLDGFVKVKYQAEDFSVSPVKEVVEYYEIIGLPTYLVLKPKADGSS